MAFHTIWSVDLGKSSLKAVKLRRDRSNIEIVAIDKIDYPITKNGVDADAQKKEALSIFRARNDVREPVAVVHQGQGTFSRFIKIPAFDEKKVKEMVGYEASQQIPFPLDEVIWDYHLVEREYLPGEEREVALFAVRKEAIEDALVDFTKEQLSVETVSIGYLGLLNFVVKDIAPEEPSVILDIGAAHTDLVLIDGKRFWIRALPHSGNDITKSIMDRFKLSFSEAEHLKIETGKAPQQAVKIFQAVIQPKLKELVGEVHRSIGFYRSQHGEVRFTKLYLLGNGSKIVGIKKFLEEQLGVQVAKVQSINHFRVSRDVNIKLLQSELPSFATSLGCGLQGLGLASCRVDLVPREEKIRKEISRKRKHAFFAAGILLVLILLARFLIIEGKLREAREAVDVPGELVGPLEKNERRLQGILEGHGVDPESIGLRAAELQGLAEVRDLALKGLQALDSVLASFPNAERVKLEAPEKEKQKVKEALGKYTAEAVYSKLWVPYLEVALTQYPEPDKSQQMKKKAEKPTSVPAYQFRAYVVVKMRDSLDDSAKHIQAAFQKKLENEITARQLSVKPVVDVMAGGQVEEIYFDPSGKAAAIIEGGQEGRGFFGAEVKWLLIPRHPPGEGGTQPPEGDGPKDAEAKN